MAEAPHLWGSPESGGKSAEGGNMSSEGMWVGAGKAADLVGNSRHSTVDSERAGGPSRYWLFIVECLFF